MDLQEAVLLLGQGVMQLGSARGQRRVARRRVDRAGMSCNECTMLLTAQEKEGKSEIAAKTESGDTTCSHSYVHSQQYVESEQGGHT